MIFLGSTIITTKANFFCISTKTCHLEWVHFNTDKSLAATRPSSYVNATTGGIYTEWTRNAERGTLLSSLILRDSTR